MNHDVAGKLTVCLLDFNRPKEAERCLLSIKQHVCATSSPQILYLSNGGDQDHAQRWYDAGWIDTLVLNKRNWGCGIGMKQMAQASLTEWVMMVQIDQYAVRPYTEEEFNLHVRMLTETEEPAFYIDLAGNQGHGRASERAHLINRRRYLDIPGMDDVIGGPGPYAQSKWTERHVQDQQPVFACAPLLFADNGKWSERDYGPAYGNARTRHSTDEKKLFILSPFSRRADGFPNLVLTDSEWKEVLEDRWPVEGKVPEADRAHSFVVWVE